MTLIEDNAVYLRDALLNKLMMHNQVHHTLSLYGHCLGEGDHIIVDLFQDRM